eukprot:295190-Lingulodinium_polyedra.AAC.1
MEKVMGIVQKVEEILTTNMSVMAQSIEKQIQEAPKRIAGSPGYAEASGSSEGLDLILKERE